MTTKATLPLILWLCLIVDNRSQEMMNDIKAVRQAIDTINQVVPNAESNQILMRDTPQYQILVQSSPIIWEASVNNLDKVAPTRHDQTILFQSFEGLAPDQYLKFLNKALDLFAQRKIALGTFKYDVFFSNGKMRFFISHNYNQPEVAAFLKRAEEVLKKDGDPFMFNVQEARSGKLKQLHDAARANHPELAKQPIPLLHPSAPLPPTAAQTTPVPAAETQSSHGFPIVPVAIIGVVIAGIIFYLLRRTSM